MSFLKSIVAAVITVVTGVVVTHLYIYAITGPHSSGRGSEGVDISLLPKATVYSPIWWLVMVVVLAVLWWLLGRWLFVK